MRYFYKFLTTILHPIVLPTIVIIGYFFIVKNTLTQRQSFAIISLVFVVTYLIPLVLFFILKKLKLFKITTNNSIKARKLPTIVIAPLYYALGSLFLELYQVREISIIFFSLSLGLFISYIYLLLKQKISIQVLFLSAIISFLIVVNNYSGYNFNKAVCLLLIITGLVGSSRLILKLNTLKEVITGFFIGFLSSIVVNFFL